MRLIRSSITAIILVVVVATSAAAGYCRQPFSNPVGTILEFCGDPHARILLDNRNAYQQDATFRLVFYHGRTKLRTVNRITVPAGGYRVISRFVAGGGRKVSLYDDANNHLFARERVTHGSINPRCTSVSDWRFWLSID